MRNLLIALILITVSCKKSNPPAPTQTIHTIVMKFHGDDPTRLLRNYTYPVNGTLVNKEDTVYLQNTTVTYQWTKSSTMVQHSMTINDIHIPLTTYQVSCELWIDNIKVASGTPGIGSSSCYYYQY